MHAFVNSTLRFFINLLIQIYVSARRFTTGDLFGRSRRVALRGGPYLDGVRVLKSLPCYNYELCIKALFKVILNKLNKFKGIVKVTGKYAYPFLHRREAQFKDSGTFSR